MVHNKGFKEIIFFRGNAYFFMSITFYASSSYVSFEYLRLDVKKCITVSEIQFKFLLNR